MDYVLPEIGEALTFAGRAYRFTRIDPPSAPFGWWFEAVSLDRTRTLRGNFAVRRLGLTGGWTT